MILPSNRRDMVAMLWPAAIVLFLVVIGLVGKSDGGVTSDYVRKPQASVCMPVKYFPSPSGFNAPEQVYK